MAVTGPNTGYKIVNVDGGPTTQDLGQRYVSKDYYLDTYPNLASTTGSRTSPGLWTWGNNTNGALGQGNTTTIGPPTQVGLLNNWRDVYSGYNTMAAIKTDGTLWTWGQNGFGQLGLGNITHISSPVQVGTLTNWKQVCVVGNAAAAIKTDGTLWTWGQNGYGGGAGGLGQSNTTNRSSPVQVGTLTNWKQVSCNGRYTQNNFLLYMAAIKTDGTLWTWGHNYNGVLGLGDTTNRSSPVQVGTLTNWKQVSCGTGVVKYYMAAIKTDGTLWAWGSNYYAELGLGDTTNRSSPVQVGTLTNWKQVGTQSKGLGGYGSSTFAIKTDGTLWSWGYNQYGNLGQGNTTNRSSPVQVGTLTNWKMIANGSYYGGQCIKTDGTLWQINYGASSPTQVGTSTNWKKISFGSNESYAGIQDGYY